MFYSFYVFVFFFFFKQKTAYEMRISDWSSDVCSSDLRRIKLGDVGRALGAGELRAKADVGDRRILDAAAPAEHGADPVDIIIGDARRRIDAEQIGARRVAEQRHADLAIALKRLDRSEEHTSELQSLMRISYAVFCMQKKKTINKNTSDLQSILHITHTLIT